MHGGVFMSAINRGGLAASTHICPTYIRPRYIPRKHIPSTYIRSTHICRKHIHPKYILTLALACLAAACLFTFATPVAAEEAKALPKSQPQAETPINTKGKTPINTNAKTPINTPINTKSKTNILSAAEIKAVMQRNLPDVRVLEVIRNEKFDVYQLLTDDYTNIFVSLDGKDFVVGDHYSYGNNAKLKNLTRERRDVEQFKSVAGIPLSEMIIFPAVDGKSKPIKSDKWVVVFTDIDCGYCRRLHDKMAEMNKLGIEVRYAFFPRSGENTPSFEKAISVWCSPDKRASMTAAKAGLEVKKAECENPVSTQYELGKKVGVRGTPTMWSSNGRKIPGYVEPQRLLRIIQGQS